MPIKQHAKLKLLNFDLGFYSFLSRCFYSSDGDYNKIEKLDYTKLLSEQNKATYNNLLNIKNEVI